MINRLFLIGICSTLTLTTLICSPFVVLAQTEAPYSFASGRKVNVQKEESLVSGASEDLITTLRGPRGEFLAVTSTGLALFSFIAGLKAGAIVFGVMAVIFLSLSHPWIALPLALIGVAIYKYRTRYDDHDFDFKRKPEDEKSSSDAKSKKDEPSESTAPAKKESGLPTKVIRPM